MNRFHPNLRLGFCLALIALTLSSCSIMVDPGYGAHEAQMRADLPASAVHGLWHRRQSVGGYDFTDTFLFRPNHSGLYKSRSTQGTKTTDHAFRIFFWRFEGGGRWTMWFEDTPGYIFEMRTDGAVILRSHHSEAGYTKEVLHKL